MRSARALACLTVAIAVQLASAAPSLGHWLDEGNRPQLTAAALGERVMSAQSGDVPPATPRAECGPGSNPEPGIQGRVPADAVESGRADKGFTCNIELLAHRGKSGGFKVHRFVDETGRECAYYDTTLLFPTNVQHLSDEPTGVAVLDMSNPSKPVRTATLADPRDADAARVPGAERAPRAPGRGDGNRDVLSRLRRHLRPERRLPLPGAAVQPARGTARPRERLRAGREHVLRDVAVHRRGHRRRRDRPEASGAALGRRLPLARPHDQPGREPGLPCRPGPGPDDPRRERDPGAQAQSTRARGQPPDLGDADDPPGGHSGHDSGQALPGRGRRVLDREGQPVPVSNGERVGAARIIDIENEQDPRVVSDLRLAVNQPENRAELAGDPGASSPAQGYAGHYCSVPRYENPGIVACSFIASGLRVFDIRDPARPREVAYFVAPADSPTLGGPEGPPSNYAMSAPAFVPERGEIWYSDGNTGFYALRVSGRAWPSAGGPGAARRSCLHRRSPIGPRNVGRVRLGFTRRRMLRRVGPAPLRRGRYAYRWCVRGSTGRVSAVFSSRSARGRARLVTTTAARHVLRGVGRGAGVRRLAQRFPGARRLARGVYRAGPQQPAHLRRSPGQGPLRRGGGSAAAGAPRRARPPPAAGGAPLAGVRVQVQRQRVDAVALARRPGAVGEDVAQVRAAAAAEHLVADHSVAVVRPDLDVLGDGGLGEARPAGAGVELGARAEQLRAAGPAAVDPVVLRIGVLAAERRLGARRSAAPGSARRRAPRATPRRSSSRSPCTQLYSEQSAGHGVGAGQARERLVGGEERPHLVLGGPAAQARQAARRA